MKIAYKALARILALTMVITLFGGCRKPDGTGVETIQTAPPDADVTQQIDTEGKTLSVWLYESFSDDANAATQARVEQFATNYDVALDYEWITEQNYLTKYNAAVEAGTLPDVTYMRSDFVLSSYPNIYLMDLSDVIDDINQENELVTAYVDLGKIENTPYIVPMFSSAQPVVYRKDLFAAAGYNTFPATWEALRDACIKVSTMHPDIAGFGIGCGVNENEGEQVLRWLMWDYGGGLFDADGNVNANAKENVQALQIYADMWNAGAVPTDAASWDAGSNNANYLQGTVAMTCNAYTILNALAGEGYEELNGNTGVAMVPSGPAGCYVDAKGYGWSVFEGTQSVETAKEFVRFMSNADWYASWIDALAPVYGPVLVDIVNTPTWQEAPGSILVEFGTNAELYGYPCLDVETQVKGAQIFNSYKLTEAMSKVIVEKMSVEDALNWLQVELESKF